MATPPDAGDVVRTGHRFALAPGPPDGWVNWQPMVVVGSDLLPPGAPLPSPLRATIGWKQGMIISRQRSRQGWVIQTDTGLLGPSDLLVPTPDADEQTAFLEVAGRVLPLVEAPLINRNGVAAIEGLLDMPSWPAARIRRGREPEDCLAVGDPTAPPLAGRDRRRTPAPGPRTGRPTWACGPLPPGGGCPGCRTTSQTRVAPRARARPGGPPGAPSTQPPGPSFRRRPRHGSRGHWSGRRPTPYRAAPRLRRVR